MTDPTPPPTTAALIARADQYAPVVASLKAFQITTPEARALINEQLVAVKTLNKELEAERTSVTKPMNAALKVVNGWFKPRQTLLTAVEDACKDAIWRYERALQAEQQRQLQAAAEAYQAGNTEAATTALAAIPDVPVVAGTSVSTRRVLRVVAPDLVPREYCSPDPGKLRAVAPGVAVPGCIWEDEANVRVRT